MFSTNLCMFCNSVGRNRSTYIPKYIVLKRYDLWYSAVYHYYVLFWIPLDFFFSTNLFREKFYTVRTAAAAIISLPLSSFILMCVYYICWFHFIRASAAYITWKIIVLNEYGARTSSRAIIIDFWRLSILKKFAISVEQCACFLAYACRIPKFNYSCYIEPDRWIIFF